MFAIILCGLPLICIKTTEAFAEATTSRDLLSAVKADTSFMILTPSSSTASITSALYVSTETLTPSLTKHLTTGKIRSSSCLTEIGCDCGLVDCPPTSIILAPESMYLIALDIASDVLNVSPPSLKLSGVTLTMPIINGESRLNPANFTAINQAP